MQNVIQNTSKICVKTQYEKNSFILTQYIVLYF